MSRYSVPEECPKLSPNNTNKEFLNNSIENENKFKQKIGNYEIIKTVGRGNFSVVKLGIHKITKTLVAIKIINKTRFDKSGLNKIYREVQIMKALHHPNILKLYQVMESQLHIYLITEYADNGEMFSYIDKRGRFNDSDARILFCQILSAVEYCHRQNIVHRDLKTENILLDKNFNVKLCDFGFSNQYNNDVMKTFCGSPPYAAPEIFNGSPYFGPTIDYWSLGVILYVMVCGSFPFNGRAVHEVREQVIKCQYRIPFFMTSMCEDLIKNILIVDSSKRYNIEQMINHPWLQTDPISKSILSNRFNRYFYDQRLPNNTPGSTRWNEQVLILMRGLGLNINDTIESLEKNLCDNLAAIYYLISDKLTSSSQVPLTFQSSTNNSNETSTNNQKTSYSTRHRRATAFAHGAIVKDGYISQIRQNTQNSPTTTTTQNTPNMVNVESPPKWLQAALKELEIARKYSFDNTRNNNSIIETNENGSDILEKQPNNCYNVRKQHPPNLPINKMRKNSCITDYSNIMNNDIWNYNNTPSLFKPYNNNELKNTLTTNAELCTNSLVEHDESSEINAINRNDQNNNNMLHFNKQSHDYDQTTSQLHPKTQNMQIFEPIPSRSRHSTGVPIPDKWNFESTSPSIFRAVRYKPNNQNNK